MTQEVRDRAAAVLAAHAGEERGFVDLGELWCAECKVGFDEDDMPHHQIAMLAEADLAITDVRRPCGGCRGLGAHSPRCIHQPGSLWRRLMDGAEDLADAIGANDPGAANAAYALAGQFREKYDEARKGIE